MPLRQMVDQHSPPLKAHLALVTLVDVELVIRGRLSCCFYRGRGFRLLLLFNDWWWCDRWLSFGACVHALEVLFEFVFAAEEFAAAGALERFLVRVPEKSKLNLGKIIIN